MGETDEIAVAMSGLRQQYVARLTRTLDELVSQAAQIEYDEFTTTLTRMHHQLHRLAGSAGTFGFDAISAEARILERSARQFLLHPDTCTPETMRAWKTAVTELGHFPISHQSQDVAAG